MDDSRGTSKEIAKIVKENKASTVTSKNAWIAVWYPQWAQQYNRILNATFPYNSENQKDAKCLMKLNDCIIKKNSFINNRTYDDIRPRVDAEGRNERQANWVLKCIIAFYARMVS